MDHSKREKQVPVFNISQNKKLILPFKRKLRFINGSARVTVPHDFVKSFNLKEGKECQFYIEVSKSSEVLR